MRRAGCRQKICVALSARGVGHGSEEACATEMLDVTGTARRSENLRRLVNRPVVAGETGLVTDRMAKGNCVRYMASRAFLSEECVRSRDGAHAVRRSTAGNADNREPQQRRDRDCYRKNEAPTAKRMRPLEVGELDSLRQLFCCSRTAWQDFAPCFCTRSAKPSQHARQRARANRKTMERERAAIRARRGAVSPGERAGALLRRYFQNL